MPTSPSRICRDCAAKAVANGYCASHQVKNERRLRKSMFDVYRADDEVRKLYRCKRWKSTRLRVLRRDVLCRSCGHQAATEADHILSARLVLENWGVDAFYDEDRIQGLCHDCHSSKTAHECGFTGKKGTKLTDVGDRTNLTIVCGVAGSGKSTYVQEHKAPDDLVWDYDVVMQEITGLPMHQGLPGAIGSVLANRDQWIEATRYSKHHGWLIVSNPQAQVVTMLRDAGATVIVMDIDEQECKRRLKQRFIEEALQLTRDSEQGK